MEKNQDHNYQVHVLVPNNEETSSASTAETNIFTWKNVRNCVSVGSRKKSEEKVLLDGISGIYFSRLAHFSHTYT